MFYKTRITCSQSLAIFVAKTVFNSHYKECTLKAGFNLVSILRVLRKTPMDTANFKVSFIRDLAVEKLEYIPH